MSEFKVVSIILLACLALCTVLGFVGCDPRVVCWYSGYANNTYAAPSFQLRGRTAGALSSDISGPVFQTHEELDKYIADNKLNMCAGAR